MDLIDVYVAGESGVHTYRIPALAVTRTGTLLAFAEARQDGGGDAGDIDLVVRRSTDGGTTWDAPITVWDDGANTCGNPAPVVRTDGRIVLPMTWNAGADVERDIIAGTSGDALAGVYLALMALIAFILPIAYQSFAFEGRKAGLVWLNLGYNAAALLCQAVIIAVWR